MDEWIYIHTFEYVNTRIRESERKREKEYYILLCKSVSESVILRQSITTI